MKTLVTVFLSCLIYYNLNAQNEHFAGKYAETITEDDLYDYLSILSSDALEGRETGERGQKMAAAFISAHFDEVGLKPPVISGTDKSYYQPVELYSTAPGNTYLEVDGKKMKNFQAIIYYGRSNTDGVQSEEIVFAGNGSYQEFEQAQAMGKAALVIMKNLKNPKVLDDAKKAGVKMVFVLSDSSDAAFQKNIERFKKYLSGGRLSLEKPKNTESAGIFIVSPSLAGKIFSTSYDKLKEITEKNALNKLKPVKIQYQIEQKIKTVGSENVLGYIEGTDKKDELVVITAHYDHEGKKGEDIYNGADDDGSGTSTVMELAEAFAMAKEDGHGPRRSMLFMTVTGEEKGLLGSSYYTEHPIFPLKNTIVDLNIDMIGRIDEAHKENPNYVYLVGSNRLSSELHEISEKANEKYSHFDLDYTYNDENHPDRIYYRSDHWNFAKNDIPVIFYFNGIHEDYHQPTDTVDKIDFALLAKRAQLVFYTAWALANRDERPVVDKLQDEKMEKN